ncbi:alpha-ketoglutarate-dependent dioxygenase AlkB [Azospirillum sp. ST 5-10]|uniref:alpha-ketoglutarate-dependent dioxygenase AlkB n=1 Tax=unclassified Azospirillum TaxID=2630922 RepID=UPI003F4A3783
MLALDLPVRHHLPPIAGLTYVADCMSAEEEGGLLDEIDRRPWLTDLKRRAQHYGYRYDYRSRTAGRDAYLGPLPDWLHALARTVSGPDHLNALAEQVIVNEYVPGQGISAHTDCVPCFGPRIVILSLGSPCVMRFLHPGTGAVDSVLLEERSLLVLSGPARYDWQHEIPARRSDMVDGLRITRRRRVSVTFRTMILAEDAGRSPYGA